MLSLDKPSLWLLHHAPAQLMGEEAVSQGFNLPTIDPNQDLACLEDENELEYEINPFAEVLGDILLELGVEFDNVIYHADPPSEFLGMLNVIRETHGVPSLNLALSIAGISQHLILGHQQAPPILVQINSVGGGGLWLAIKDLQKGRARVHYSIGGSWGMIVLSLPKVARLLIRLEQRVPVQTYSILTGRASSLSPGFDGY